MIRFFFVLLYSYLSDFAWIIRSKNFAKHHLSSVSTVPRVLRVQRYYFFLSLKHFSKLFFYFFSLFLLHTEKQPVTRKKKHEKRRRNTSFPSEKRILRGQNWQENLGKYHKSGLFTEKQNGNNARKTHRHRQKKRRKAHETDKWRECRILGPHAPRGTGRTTTAPSLAKTTKHAKKKHTLLINIRRRKLKKVQ